MPRAKKQPESRPFWSADKIERRKLADLKPYPNNPRTHSPEQVTQIVSSMREFGFTQPMIIDEDNMILAGHGRAMASQNLGLVDVPVIVRANLTPAQKRAIVIADNQIAANAGWDDALLKIEITELKKLDFDLSLLGFPDLKLVEFVSGLGDGVAPQAEPETGGADRELTEEETRLLNVAWRKMVADWAAIVKRHADLGFLSTSYTRGSLAVAFMRARLYGLPIPSPMTLAYTPHRFFTIGDKGSYAQVVAQSTDEVMSGLRFVTKGAPGLDKFLLAGTLAVRSCRMPGEFPVDLARDLYDEFVTEPGGVVLDPCHGWGGRMLGFLLSKHAVQYDGWDVDPKTHRGVRELFADLRGLAASKKGAATYCEPFETAKLKPNRYDFALTSPPYFNVEKYGGDQSSWKLYSDYDKWVAGFYAPMIQSVAKALKPKAAFALQVGNQSYPLEESAKSIADGCGLWYLETRHTGMINNYNKTEKDDGEVIIIFRKGTPENPALKDA